MEKVFWLMWLADIAGAVGLIGCVALITGALAVLAWAMFMAADGDSDEFTRLMKSLRWLAVPIVIAGLTPNPNTIRVLAVASVSDAAANTQLGQKGVEALNALLDKVIATAKESKK